MSVIGKRSLAKPGSMPVVKHDASPSSHASVIGSSQLGGFCFIAGQTHGVIAVEQTSTPARRNAMTRMLSSGVRGRPVVDERIRPSAISSSRSRSR